MTQIRTIYKNDTDASTDETFFAHHFVCGPYNSPLCVRVSLWSEMLRPASGRKRQERAVSGRWREPRLRHGAEMSQSRADTRSSESPGPWHQTTWSQSPPSGRDGTIVPSLHSLHQTLLRTRAMISATLTSSLPRCLSLAEAVVTSRGALQLSSAILMTPRPQDRQDHRFVTVEAPWQKSQQTILKVTQLHLTPEKIITMWSLRIPRPRQFVFRVVSISFSRKDE